MRRMITDRKPNKGLAFYTPLALGVLTGFAVEPLCDCPLPKLLLIKTMVAIVAFGVSWLVVMIMCHAYYFFKSLLHHPR